MSKRMLSAAGRRGAAMAAAMCMAGGYEGTASAQSATWKMYGSYEPYSRVARISEVVEWDDGTGPALYVVGDFTNVGGSWSSGVAKYDGERFTPLGCGLSGPNEVYSMVSYDGEVEAACAWDPDGVGPLASVLVVGGRFGMAGGQTVYNVAAWDGQSWSTLGDLSGDTGLVSSYIFSRVHDLEVFNGELYACGNFSVSGGEKVARWNGTYWEGVDYNLAGAWGLSMCVHNDGTGEALYFTGPDFNGVHKLVGTNWQNLCTAPGMPGFGTTEHFYAMSSYDPDGAGPQPAMLCLGGQTYGPVLTLWTWTPASGWDAHSFADSSYPSTQIQSARVQGMAVMDHGNGPLLCMTTALFDVEPSDLLREYWCVRTWNGTSFSTLGQPRVVPAGEYLSGGVCSKPVVSSAFGEERLYYWPVTRESALASVRGTDVEPSYVDQGEISYVTDMTMMDPDGAGPMPRAAYCVGTFGASPSNAAAFDGETYTALPALPEYASYLNHNMIAELTCTSMDDGSGEAFYVAVTEVAGTSVYKLVGGAWQSLGSPGAFYSFNPQAGDAGQRNDRINHMVGYNDGAGTKLYVTGRFVTVDGVTCNHIARWNGSAWEPLPGGTMVGLQGHFQPAERIGKQLVAFDDGSGPALYVNGYHFGGGGVSSPGLVRWNGSVWQQVPSPMPSHITAKLVVHGQQLFGGVFERSSASSDIKVWNGAAWVPAVSGLSDVDQVFLAGSYRDGCGESYLYGIGMYVPAAEPFYRRNAGVINHLYRYEETGWTRLAAPTFVGDNNRVFQIDVPSTTGLLISGIFGGVDAQAHYDCTTGTSFGMDRYASVTAIWGCQQPVCAADFNNSGSVSVQDIFDFLGAWFAGNASADVNASGGVTVQDIFDFLGVWFAGC